MRTGGRFSRYPGLTLSGQELYDFLPTNSLVGFQKEKRLEQHNRLSSYCMKVAKHGYRRDSTSNSRSLSRGQLVDEKQPRKTASHGHLSILDPPKSLRNVEASYVQEKSFRNGAFIDSPEDVNTAIEIEKGKDVGKSASTTNLKSPHDFQHHILDDVLEENEEEVGLKNSKP
ncbi:hypothetical protein DICVIV_01128 [Dictyocaulus viviparus]|uniref:Uncharacterized protein n=1 Tax=Dictyocaulus viviparus TaxID=29172 RepID=A0A0D8Y8X1_DICVI|nr:hypothetical protein DICVIV_01128 [Dictyocaulus viviparus]